MMSDPLNEILQVERSVAAAISAAREEAAVAVTEARRQGERLVEAARARGKELADQRYEEGLARARDEGDLIRSTADEKVARLRRQAQAHVSPAVDLVMATVLPSPEET
jgi:vacuolar-type H+-ATPase subunit H